MADIFKAYSFLNQTLALKFSKAELSRVERLFKKDWMAKNQFDEKIINKVDDWEFFAHITPRKRSAITPIKRSAKSSK